MPARRHAGFSSNYALYGDMSARANSIYRAFSPHVEIYEDVAGIRPNSAHHIAAAKGPRPLSRLRINEEAKEVMAGR